MTTIKTVADICQLISDNLNSDNETLKNHAETLLGPRIHGSTTNKALSTVNKNTPVKILDTPQVKGAKCYIFDAPELGGKLGAIPLSDAITRGLRDSIKERDGMHGKELHTGNIQLDIDEPRICVIIGDFESETAIYTWHPGMPLTPYKGGYPDFDSMDIMTAVKLN